MKATGQKTPRLAGHSANIVGQQMYIFGGRSSSREYSNALYSVDLGTPPPFRAHWHPPHRRAG